MDTRIPKWKRRREMLTKAHKTDPKHLANLSRLASFYEKVRGDHKKSEDLNRKAEKIHSKRNRQGTKGLALKCNYN